jgi:hypothetical protein
MDNESPVDLSLLQEVDICKKEKAKILRSTASQYTRETLPLGSSEKMKCILRAAEIPASRR